MNKRQILIRINLLNSLAGADGLPVLMEYTQQEVAMATPKLLPTEFDEAVRTAEQERLIDSLDSPRGKKSAINDAGRMWLTQNRF